ncbi:TonB-dependent receptor [Sunxiuqinia dokdonensis]|uniref:TonB-denpendent receptor n=1 Tax=Sunxiuqinia dokdonensis TaxID=1409788 RepID=A0A0L8V2X2_9BACT|nr:TonB-dependent receptor [Sunxiuqinia dokdonensis]KOH42781.1 tonB-denpendent receptor [Sunxiuqinia dokdonensis]
MKFILLLLLLTVHSFGSVYSQSTKLSVDLHNVTTVQILEAIESQTEFKFLYNDDLLDANKYHNIKYKNKTVEEILDEILAGTGNSYSIMANRLIVITPSDSPVQQAGTITGVVSSKSGELLPGVSVIEKGTTNGTVTDLDGQYSLRVSSSDAVLVFSFIGYKTQEVQLSGSNSVSVELAEDVVGLDEVVVVGYGSVKKSDLTGSVSTVKAEDIAAYPSVDMAQALQGRAAGVQISANNGEPGSSFKVRIRGGTSINSSSDPLYVVDGFPGGSLPPAEDIASIEVLKDASATAIYGSRGANGVVMVTTKKGQSGKTKIEFNTSYSMQKEINRLDLLGAQDFVDYVNDANPGTLPSTPTGNTNWQDVIFQNGAIQNYQLSFSGGNENVRYYVSGVVYDHKGIIIGSKYKRYSVTSNVDFNLTDRIKLGANLFAQRTDRDGSHTQEGSGGTNNTGIIASAFTMAPSIAIQNDEGIYTLSPVGDPRDNPYAIATERQNNAVADIMQANFYGELSIVDNLKFRTTLGAKTYNNRDGLYISTKLNAGRNVGGSARINANKNTDLISENYFTYNKLFSNIHDLTLMAGYSYQYYTGEFWGTGSTEFVTDDFQWWNLGGGSIPNNSSSWNKSELSSYYGRLNYKLKDKYLLTLNARYDGSSRFAENEKWAFFPSGALAWNVAEESFMDGLRNLSQLKLRGSYGITGNQAIGPYQSLARFGTVYTIINGRPVNAVRPTSVANDNLTWESTGQLDIGFDLGLFDQRIYLVADYYRMKTSDLLFSLPLPEYSGFPSMIDNIGSVENKGFEFTLSTVNIEKELNWKTDFNISFNRNKVLELPDGNDILYAANPGHMVGFGDTHVLREGEPVGVFFGYTYDGVYQEGDTFLPGAGFEQAAGGEKYKDISENGTLGNEDRSIIGNPHPDFIWGMNNALNYKDFDLNFFIQGSQGNDVYSFTLMELELMGGVANSTTRALDRWTPTNTNTDVPRANSGRARISSTRWVEDGSYVRMKNISLGYQVPKFHLRRLGLASARIYVSGQNLLTITGYRGYDPEVNYNSGGNTNSNRNLGLDYGSYPNAKSYTVGLQVTF